MKYLNKYHFYVESLLKNGPELDPEILSLFKELGQELVYQRDEHLIYKDHVPKFGFILLEGRAEIHLSRSKRSILPFSIVGIKEITLNIPYQNAVKVFEGAKILMLDKSVLKEAQEHLELKRFLDGLLSKA